MAHIKTYENGTIALVDTWTTEDVYSCAEDNDLSINEDIAIKTLELMARSHDANIGINWNSMLFAIEQAMQISSKESNNVFDLIND